MVWALPTNSFRIVRSVLGVVLLIAAALKGYAVATEPVIGAGVLGTRWLAIAVVNVELFCGLWLLTNWLSVWTWRGAVALFSLFALASVSKIIAGEASCGCFGRVPVILGNLIAILTTVVDILEGSRLILSPGVLRGLKGCRLPIRVGTGSLALPYNEFGFG